jgi:dihydrolipoamide dehydrogenase
VGLLPHRRAGVYAIGDVAGPPWLAHKAMHEGVIWSRRSPA